MECAQPLGEALLTLSLSQRIDKVPSTRSDDDDEKRIVHGACVRTREDGRSKVCEHWSWQFQSRPRRAGAARPKREIVLGNLSFELVVQRFYEELASVRADGRVPCI